MSLIDENNNLVALELPNDVTLSDLSRQLDDLLKQQSQYDDINLTWRWLDLTDAQVVDLLNNFKMY